MTEFCSERSRNEGYEYLTNLIRPQTTPSLPSLTRYQTTQQHLVKTSLSFLITLTIQLSANPPADTLLLDEKLSEKQKKRKEKKSRIEFTSNLAHRIISHCAHTHLVRAYPPTLLQLLSIVDSSCLGLRSLESCTSLDLAAGYTTYFSYPSPVHRHLVSLVCNYICAAIHRTVCPPACTEYPHQHIGIWRRSYPSLPSACQISLSKDPLEAIHPVGSSPPSLRLVIFVSSSSRGLGYPTVQFYYLRDNTHAGK